MCIRDRSSGAPRPRMMTSIHRPMAGCIADMMPSSCAPSMRLAKAVEKAMPSSRKLSAGRGRTVSYTHLTAVGEQERVLQRGVAAAGHGDGAVLVEGAVADLSLIHI